MLTEAPRGSLAARLVSTQRVAVVEDDADIADFLRAYFRASGYDFVHLDPTDGDAAVDELIELAPDAILLDLGLRGITGQDLYRLLRRESAFDDTPVIVVTAIPRQISGMELDANDDYVEKPFSVAGLADRVQARLAGEPAEAPEQTAITVMSALDRSIQDSSIGGGPVSLALVRLPSAASIERVAGEPGLKWVMAHLTRAMRRSLPDRCIIGATGDDELAIVLPQTPVGAAAQVVQRSVDELQGRLSLPGGAEVKVDLAAGVASHPLHGADVDTVYGAADAALADAHDRGARLRAAG